MRWSGSAVTPLGQRENQSHQRASWSQGGAIGARGVSRAYPPGAIVQGIPLARRQALRYLVHDLDDLPHDITAVAPSGALEQISNRRADCHLSIVGSGDRMRRSA